MNGNSSFSCGLWMSSCWFVTCLLIEYDVPINATIKNASESVPSKMLLDFSDTDEYDILFDDWSDELIFLESIWDFLLRFDF